MTPETILDKFDQLADAPNAVAKLRELILQLAAHGKLVEQSPNDEPASELVARIETNFEQLRSRGELRGSPVEALEHEELPKIPSSWEWTRLGNVVDYGSPDKAESVDIPDNAWLLDLEDIEKDTSRVLQRKTFRDSPSKSTKTAFAAGDVLYGKLRPYLNKVIVADAPGYCTTEIIPIRSFGFIEPAYLCHTLKRPEFLAYANSKSYGMNLPRLGTDDARRAAFPLPPLAEQKRIVAKVDQLMALCDRLESQLRERDTRHAALTRSSLARFSDAPTPANLNFLFHRSYTISPADLRNSILTLAVQGKLVPQQSEPQVGSLESILAEASVNGVSKGPTSDTSATEILRISAGTSRGDFYVNEYDFKHVDLPPDEIQKFQLAPGDLLACRFNGNLHFVGRFSYYRGESGRVQVNPDKLIRFRIDTESHCPRYVCFAMNAAPTREVIEAMCATTAGNIGLSAGRLKTVEIPLPPLAEQCRIVAKVDQLMALVDQLEAELTQSRATAEKLMEAVVAELTAQD